MSSSQQKFLAKAGLIKDSSANRHASPASSMRSAPKSPVSDTFSTSHITSLAKKGIRNILHARTKSDDHTKAVASLREESAASVPSEVATADKSATADAPGDPLTPRRSHSVKSVVSTAFEDAPDLDRPDSRDTSSMLPTDFFFSATPETSSEEGSPSRRASEPASPLASSPDSALAANPASRPASAHGERMTLPVMPPLQHRISSSSNARLQKILADKDLDRIITDTLSMPSTVLSTAKSTGRSTAPTSVSSLGIFPPKSDEETSYRLSASLPPLPLSAPASKTVFPNLSLAAQDDSSQATSQATSKPGSRGEQPASPPATPPQLTEEERAHLSSWPVSAYKTGKIKTDHTFGLYAIPFMTAMDVLCQSTAVNDEQVVDDMTDYFAALGDMEPMVNTIDLFWKASNDLLTPVTATPVRPRPRMVRQESATYARRASRHDEVPELDDSLDSDLLLPPTTNPHTDTQRDTALLRDPKRLSVGAHSTASTSDEIQALPTCYSPRDSQRGSPALTHAATAAAPGNLPSLLTSSTAASAPLGTVASASLLHPLQHQHQQEGHHVETSGAAGRLAKSPHRMSELFESGAGGAAAIRNRFSIRKMLSRHNMPS